MAGASGSHKWVYSFGGGKNDGRSDMRNLLGGKGANLAEMSSLGLPVPPGFTITTEGCTAYYANEHRYPDELSVQIDAAMGVLEEAIDAGFGKVANPLLVSVRSGARVSMPGMMDTVLNLGLNDATVEGLVVRSGDARFAYDSYRRFIQMYGNVVLNIDHHEFEDVLETFKRDGDLNLDTDLSAEDLQEVIRGYKKVVEEAKGKPFPQDVKEQLEGAIGAVFGIGTGLLAYTHVGYGLTLAAWARLRGPAGRPGASDPAAPPEPPPVSVIVRLLA